MHACPPKLMPKSKYVYKILLPLNDGLRLDGGVHACMGDGQTMDTEVWRGRPRHTQASDRVDLSGRWIAFSIQLQLQQR